MVHPMNTQLVFQTDTPSHEWWIRFVDQFPELDLSHILNLLENTYGTKFRVTTDSWSLEFPDQDALTQFLLTWS